MSLIRGSRGIIYFVHQFEPTFKEASLLDDEELLPAVTLLNRQLMELAPVLNSPTVTSAIEVDRSSSEVPIAVMCKRHAGSLYVFAVNLGAQQTKATLRMLTPGSPSSVEVLDENRSLEIRDRKFEDEFAGYGVRCYRIAG